MRRVVTLEDDLAFALGMTHAAAEVALPLFRRGVDRRQKLDGSVVTEGDVAVEKRLLEMLTEARPNDAILSEECGSRGSGRRRWILDPIDGTHWFASGEPTWGTHVALEEDGQIVLGVISRPARGQCYWAARGSGAHAGALGSSTPERRLQVSETRDLARSRVIVWAHPDDPRHDLLRAHALQADPRIDAVLDVAHGTLEAVVDCQGEIWDMAPGVVIVAEAGGSCVGADGGQDFERPGSWFTNGKIDAALRRLLA